MKTRSCFVANSSSSSFIILGKILNDVNAKELTPNQRLKVETRLGIFHIPNSIPVYLTQYFSDCSPIHNEISKGNLIYEYDSGNHGGPYDEDEYDEIDDNIWILKEDNTYSITDWEQDGCELYNTNKENSCSTTFNYDNWWECGCDYDYTDADVSPEVDTGCDCDDCTSQDIYCEDGHVDDDDDDYEEWYKDDWYDSEDDELLTDCGDTFENRDTDNEDVVYVRDDDTMKQAIEKIKDKNIKQVLEYFADWLAGITYRMKF